MQKIAESKKRVWERSKKRQLFLSCLGVIKKRDGNPFG